MGLRDLESFGRALRELGEEFPKTRQAFAREVSRSIDRQFTRGTDPYGKPWAPLAPATLAKGRTPPPLTDTGASRGDVDVRATSGGIAIAINDILEIHQKGDPTRNLPARKTLPDAGTPRSWERSLEAIAKDALERKLGGF